MQASQHADGTGNGSSMGPVHYHNSTTEQPSGQVAGQLMQQLSAKSAFARDDTAAALLAAQACQQLLQTSIYQKQS
jgi:hypothetical protein